MTRTILTALISAAIAGFLGYHIHKYQRCEADLKHFTTAMTIGVE